MSNSTRLIPAEYYRAYRERTRATGTEDVMFRLPGEVVTLLDELKERHGLRNRSQALLQLVEHWRATTQHTT
jgi:hypothetical protein